MSSVFVSCRPVRSWCFQMKRLLDFERASASASNKNNTPVTFLAQSSSLHQCRCMCTNKSSNLKSKVPESPTMTNVPLGRLPELPEIDLALVEQLERMALVQFVNERGLRELRNAVKSANQLLHIDTEGVEPMYSVLENRSVWLRDDEVTEGNSTEEILSNATKVEEQLYFVAPPGNIPLKKKHREHLGNFLERELSKEDS